MSDFIESLPADERRLLEVATELREAREEAQKAAAALDPGRMRIALARLQLANEVAGAAGRSRR